MHGNKFVVNGVEVRQVYGAYYISPHKGFRTEEDAQEFMKLALDGMKFRAMKSMNNG